DRRCGHQRRRDRAERRPGRHDRLVVHRGAQRPASHVEAPQGPGPAAHPLPRSLRRRPHRQGIDRRYGHALARGDRGSHVPHACRGGNQYPDDLHLGDQAHGGHRREVHRARRARAAPGLRARPGVKFVRLQHPDPERCPSGRRGRPAKALYGQNPYRGFESLSLRQDSRYVREARLQRFLHAFVAILCGFAALATTTARAQFPERAVTLVVPFAPGDETDAVARLIATKLTERWGRAVFVENKPGNDGVAGAEFVARAEPDGHVLLIGNVRTQAINPLMKRKLPYDPDQAFAPVSEISAVPLVLLVHPSIKAQAPRDLVALAKAKSTLKYASSGNGSLMHLAAALFES